MQLRRHDSLQIFEHARPGECLALYQPIQELRLIPRAAVDGHVEEGLCRRTLVVAFRDLVLQLRDVMAISSGVGPTTHRQAQQNERQHAQQAHSQSPAYPEFAGIFIGPGCEIDIETHIYGIRTNLLLALSLWLLAKS